MDDLVKKIREGDPSAERDLIHRIRSGWEIVFQSPPPDSVTTGLSSFVEVVSNYGRFGADRSLDLEFVEALSDPTLLRDLLGHLSVSQTDLSISYLVARAEETERMYGVSLKEEKARVVGFFPSFTLGFQGTVPLWELILSLKKAEDSSALISEPSPPPPVPANPPPSVSAPPRSVLFLSFDRPKNEALQRYFNFEVDWVCPNSPREISSYRDRIANGYYDFVFIVANRVSHKAVQQILSHPRVSGDGSKTTPVLYVHGFGVRAIEKALQEKNLLIPSV